MKSHLILLHGALGSRAHFSPWIPLLKGHFEVHTFDFPGHGMAQVAEGGFHMQAFADALVRYCEEWGITEANVFGYSMGGYAALVAASQTPGLFQRIMTLGTKFDWNPEGAAREVKMLDAATIEAKVPKFAAALEATHRVTGWRTVLDLTAQMMLQLGHQPLLNNEILAQLDLPVRICLGDRDNMVSLSESSDAFRALPKGEFQVFPQTWHPIERVDAQRICDAILEFFP
ncbi:MAG: alpha/beta fold hydrolase [Bacteroidia bacterium]|nr:alpha/beta fold hydrolase [Bacteroidia bacterium]